MKNFFSYLIGILLIAVIIVIFSSTPIKISIDTDTSYELGVNILGQVVNIQGKDTTSLVRKNDIGKNSVSFVTYEIIKSSHENNYFDLYKDVIISFYRTPKWLQSQIEKMDFDYGEIIVKKVTKEDVSLASQYSATSGKISLIRDYTNNYGGDFESNILSLKSANINNIINRHSVHDEVTNAILDIFEGFGDSSNQDIDDDDVYFREDEPTPIPTSTPDLTVPISKIATSAPVTKKGNDSKNKSSKKDDADVSKSSSSPTTPQPTSIATPTATLAATPVATSAATPKPSVAPIKTDSPIARPTANPIG